METFNPGTPMEMITVYHGQQGKLAMTHCCMLGNQPTMCLVDASDKQLTLDLVKNLGINKDDPHMNALTIDLVDADRSRHTCGSRSMGDKMKNMTIGSRQCCGRTLRGALS